MGPMASASPGAAKGLHLHLPAVVLGTSSSEAAMPTPTEKREQPDRGKAFAGLTILTGRACNLDGSVLSLSNNRFMSEARAITNLFGNSWWESTLDLKRAQAMLSTPNSIEQRVMAAD
jgi:Na+/H+-dicarboxylate symporter